MAIKPFKRINNYFDGFTKLKAANLDLQFNMIGDYLNREVLPILNTISTDAVPGSNNPADTGKFLQNVGDGTVKWAHISNNNFALAGLPISKLNKIDAGGILAAGNDFKIISIKPNTDHQVLSYNGEIAQWQLFTAENFEDRTITGNKIIKGTLTSANLPLNLLNTQLLDDSMEGAKFLDESITTEKLSKNAGEKLTFEKLTPQLQQDFATKIFSGMIPNNFLGVNSPTERALAYGYLAEFNRVLGENTIYPVSKFAPAKFEHTSGLLSSYTAVDNVITPVFTFMLQKGSINGKRLQCPVYTSPYNMQLSSYNPSTNSILADESIGIEHLSLALRIKLGFN